MIVKYRQGRYEPYTIKQVADAYLEDTATTRLIVLLASKGIISESEFLDVIRGYVHDFSVEEKD